MSALLLATTNAGKQAELARALRPLGLAVASLADHPDWQAAPETGRTCAENARLKALHYAGLCGGTVLADDSGLEVAALGGAPGVRSARYAGEAATDADNRALLLERLRGLAERRARFVCALCLVEEGRVTLEVEGECSGRITEAPRGTRGFGYDPLFVPDDPRAGGRTFAEMGEAEKQALSHRGRAVQAFVQRRGAPT